MPQTNVTRLYRGVRVPPRISATPAGLASCRGAAIAKTRAGARDEHPTGMVVSVPHKPRHGRPDTNRVRSCHELLETLAAVLCCVVVRRSPRVHKLKKMAMLATSRSPPGCGRWRRAGSISESAFGDVDMYESSSPEAVPLGIAFGPTHPLYLDAQLYLFDANGRGVYANDNQWPPDPNLPKRGALPANHPLTPVQPGRYYLRFHTPQPAALRTDPLCQIEPCRPDGRGSAGDRLVGHVVLNGNYSISLTALASFESPCNRERHRTDAPRAQRRQSASDETHFNAVTSASSTRRRSTSRWRRRSAVLW